MSTASTPRPSSRRCRWNRRFPRNTAPTLTPALQRAPLPRSGRGANSGHCRYAPGAGRGERKSSRKCTIPHHPAPFTRKAGVPAEPGWRRSGPEWGRNGGDWGHDGAQWGTARPCLANSGSAPGCPLPRSWETAYAGKGRSRKGPMSQGWGDSCLTPSHAAHSSDPPPSCPSSIEGEGTLHPLQGQTPAGYARSQWRADRHIRRNTQPIVDRCKVCAAPATARIQAS